MTTDCPECPYQLAHRLQFENLARDINELKDRVRGLETTLSRGTMLLVANLVGVIMTLADRVLKL